MRLRRWESIFQRSNLEASEAKRVNMMMIEEFNIINQAQRRRSAIVPSISRPARE